MNKHQVARFIAAYGELKELAEEVKELKAALLADMQTEGVTDIDTPLGTISIRIRESYVYPDLIKKMEEGVKQAKKDSVQRGNVEVETTEYLHFKS